MSTSPAASNPTLRDLARSRAAEIIGISEEKVEDDLLDFLVLEGGDALLQARAGSGKSTALTIKAAFLVKDLGVDPSTIMMLTFNKAAADSLQSRLKACGVPEGVRVRTFHALGRRIVMSHWGNARRCIFDEKTDDALAIKRAMQEALDEIATDPFFHFCASRLKRRYEKSRDYVESIGRDALENAVNFLRTRGYGMQDVYAQAWDNLGPIGGNAMKAVLAYEARLKDLKLLDPTSTLQAASWTLESEIETGRTRVSDAHGVDWLFIDEYQDVSRPYMRLVSAIRRLNGMINVMAVGDDWQAINGFAGADLDYYLNVENHLEDPVRLKLLRNRRSGSKIVDWGNAVMETAGYGGPEAVAAPENGEGEVKSFYVSGQTDISYTGQRLAGIVDPQMASVALIGRKRKVGDHKLNRLVGIVEKELRKSGYCGTVTGITAHGSKGLEWDQVLLLDDGSFPHEHPARPIMERLIPEEDFLREEACLKHVAGTRAKKRLDIIKMG